MIRLLAMIAMAALLAQAAIAGPWGGLDARVQSQMQQRPQPNQFQRPPQRDFGGRQQMAPDREQRADGRMSEEERRNLHRDLDRANREIYKGHR